MPRFDEGEIWSLTVTANCLYVMSIAATVVSVVLLYIADERRQMLPVYVQGIAIFTFLAARLNADLARHMRLSNTLNAILEKLYAAA